LSGAGNKLNNVRIVYTPWSNLNKTGDMATGQVGFKNLKQVRRRTVDKRVNEIVNRLNKTKVLLTAVVMFVLPWWGWLW